MNRYAFFLGCTVPRYVMQYEISSRWICKHLGIELVDIDDFVCCGLNQIDIKQDAGLLLAAMNLALAEAEGLNILTLCTACAGALTEAGKRLNDEEERDKVNSTLKVIGLEYEGTVSVKHISRVLYEDIGIEKIGGMIKEITERKTKGKTARSLSNYRVAPHYGCHYLKPGWIFDGFDEPDNPKTLHQLISITGAFNVEYETLNLCCGGKIFPISKDITLSLVRKKLNNLKEKGIDAMVLQCPTCYLMYGEMQEEINKRFGEEYEEHNVAVIFYPQLLGLALGGDPKSDLGFDLNAIPLKNQSGARGAAMSGCRCTSC